MDVSVHVLQVSHKASSQQKHVPLLPATREFAREPKSMLDVEVVPSAEMIMTMQSASLAGMLGRPSRHVRCES